MLERDKKAWIDPVKDPRTVDGKTGAPGQPYRDTGIYAGSLWETVIFSGKEKSLKKIRYPVYRSCVFHLTSR